MKKTKFLTLALITSALASCQTARPDYETQFNDHGVTDSVPNHWYSAAQLDSMSYQMYDMYYRRDSILNYHAPGSFFCTPYVISPPIISRGGFGYSHPHMSFAS